MGGKTNAFQSVAGFSFPPAVDEDRGRGREKGRGGELERQCRGWEPSGEIPRPS